MADYGSVEYWDTRYKREGEEPFEWYQPFEALKPLLAQYLKEGQRVLVVGCGNSALSVQLADEARPKEVCAVDFSPVAIEMMRSRYPAATNVKFEVMDATRLSYEAGSFDLVLDKGTMDSVLCSDQGEEGCRRMCRSVARVLRPGGVYFAVSHSAPENRKPYLQNEEYGWEVFPHLTLTKPPIGNTSAPNPDEVHYCYIARRAA